MSDPHTFLYQARLKKGEVIRLVIASIVTGFVMSFWNWGSGSAIDVAYGLMVLLFSIMIALIIIFLRTAVQKLLAYKLGYNVNYDLSRWGLAASIFITFMTNGVVPFISPTGMIIDENKRLRLGSFRGGLKYSDLAKISLAGPLVSVLLMILVKPIAMISQNYLILKIIQINAALSFFMLLPIPDTEGFHVFYYRRWLWLFSISFVAFYFALILFMGVFSYVVAILLAAFVTLIYVNEFE